MTRLFNDSSKFADEKVTGQRATATAAQTAEATRGAEPVADAMGKVLTEESARKVSI